MKEHSYSDYTDKVARAENILGDLPNPSRAEELAAAQAWATLALSAAVRDLADIYAQSHPAT